MLPRTNLQGLKFLDSAEAIWNSYEKGQLQESMMKQMWRWLEHLLSLIDVTSDKAKDLLKPFIGEKDEGVVKTFKKKLCSHVSISICMFHV